MRSWSSCQVIILIAKIQNDNHIMNRLQFILLPALLFCTVSLFGQSSSHRALYISTIDEDDYAAVYDILQSTFDDFPAADDRKIKYESTTEDERLVIVLLHH